jgi:hypothetical protein
LGQSPLIFASSSGISVSGPHTSQAGYSAVQDRSTQMDRSTREMGQGDQRQFIDYHAGFQHGFEQGFKQGQVTAAMQQGQGTTGQGSSQPPQRDRGGQQ